MRVSYDMRGLLVVGMLLAASVEARASCGVPWWVGTATDTHVPVRGVIYVHSEQVGWSGTESADWLDLTWPGAQGTARVTRVEEAVASIAYEGPAGATLEIGNGYGNKTRVVLDADWRAPSAPPRVLQYAHYEDQWTCSWADSLLIQLDQPVAAVRAHWTINGHAVDYIEAVDARDGKNVLELGKINCGGQSIPIDQLRDGGELELYAIRLDGSEARISGMPRHVDFDDMAVVNRSSEFGFTIVATQNLDVIEAIPVLIDNDPGPGLGLIILIVTALGVFAGVWLLRRVEPPASDC